MKTSSEELEFRILRNIADQPDLSQRQLALKHEVSLGKINYCINALLQKGLIKARNFKNNDNKWAYMYNLTPQGIEQKAKMTAEFLRRKMHEYDQLQGEIEALKKEVIN